MNVDINFLLHKTVFASSKKKQFLIHTFGTQSHLGIITGLFTLGMSAHDRRPASIRTAQTFLASTHQRLEAFVQVFLLGLSLEIQRLHQRKSDLVENLSSHALHVALPLVRMQGGRAYRVDFWWHHSIFKSQAQQVPEGNSLGHPNVEPSSRPRSSD